MSVKKAILALAIIGAILVPIFFLGSASASFDANNLIDDQVFDNTTSMTADQIDGFLNDFPNSCISTSSGFSSPDPTGYSPSTGYTYGANVSAGHVIYDSAQAYDINPQVLLATMEKEQSLVTGDAGCTSHQYVAAMGYGCPDGGSCPDSPSVTGFSQQVIHAAWLLKFSEQRAEGNMAFDIDKGNWNNSDDPGSCYGGPMTQGTYQTCPDGSYVYYDGYTTIDSQSVYMENGATAALYYYTPHFPGNENFDTIFTTWFGSTVGTDLVRSPDNATVYLISSTNKYPISDQNVLNDFGVLGPISYVTDTYLNSLTTGPTLGHMIGNPDGTLYFVDADIKLPFTSCTEVANYGYTCSSVIDLTAFQLNQLANGPDMTSYYQTTSGKNFYITNGQKEEIFDQTSAADAGLSPSYNTLLEGGIAYLPYGPPIIHNQVLVNDRTTETDYYYESGTFTALTADIASRPAFTGLPYGTLDNASIQTQTVDNNFNGFVTNTEGTDDYVLTSLGKAQLTNPANWLPQGSFTALSDSFLSSIANDSTDPINNGIVKSQNNATVYDVLSQEKRPIPSWQDLVNLQVTPFSINALTDTELNALPTGSIMYSSGQLVKTPDSATVYVIKDPTYLYSISSFTIPEELGLDSSSILNISDSVLDSYTNLGLLQSQVVCNGTDYVGILGHLYVLSATQLTQYGFNSSDFVGGSSLCLNAPISPQLLGDFIRVANGTIYLVQNGAKQAFTNYSAYVAHGGTAQGTVEVSDYFASLIPSGQNITQ